MTMTEDDWEHHTLDTLAELGWTFRTGTEIAPGSGERERWSDLHIPGRMLAALRSLNPQVPPQYLQQALGDIVRVSSTDAVTENHRIHRWYVEGYRDITYLDGDGRERTPTISLISPDPSRNDWLVANQVTVRTTEHRRRFDVVLYCNGMPVSVVELKQAGRSGADPAAAYRQLQTYLKEFPTAFRFAVFNLASDGISALYGTPFTPLHHWAPWNVDESGVPVAADTNALEVALHGLYDHLRFLQLTRSYVAFDEGDHGLGKRIAKPHQYFAVSKAVGATSKAVHSNGKAGVVWHTQGSGKSLEMELYANQVLRSTALSNPTVVVITDRNELDGQLFSGFQRSRLLPEKPSQIRRRSELRRELTDRRSGGILFTTLQKFGMSKAERDGGMHDHPLLSDRHNIIVVVDEAHRSHYDDLDGYAAHLKHALPNATLIAFTGTPISQDERDTQAVFGEYIDIYDLTRAVADKATVPVYFEPRLIRLTRPDGVSDDDLDRAADEATALLDDTERTRVEASVTVLNAAYGAPARIEKLAADLVAHWELRRDAVRSLIEVPGKAMIVGNTREICAKLYEAIVALRPDWHSDDIHTGRIKVVYSGDASDSELIRRHERRESENKVIKERIKRAKDELELVIVKDMMLTGFDAPPLHTLYLDRPIKGALLMQTLARVNRTYKGKDSGLLVGYAPLADNLQQALAEYTAQDQQEKPVGKDLDDAVQLVRDLVARIDATLAGTNWRSRLDRNRKITWSDAAQQVANHLRSPATPGNTPAPGDDPEHFVSLQDRFRRDSRALGKAWAVCVGRVTDDGADGLARLRRDVQFYEEVRVYMAEFDAAAARAAGRPIPEDIERLLASLIADNTVSGEVLDIYAAAGLSRPELSELTPAYVTEAQQAKNPQLAIEALRNLVVEESVKATRSNVTRQRAFSERVTTLMAKYTNQQLTAAEVIAELVAMARDVMAEAGRGQQFEPALGESELALYDTLAQNESAMDVMGDDVLAAIARELMVVVRRDRRTDWTVRDDVRAKLRSSIKRLLVKYKYPPDKQPGAITAVMEQMELMAPEDETPEHSESEDDTE